MIYFSETQKFRQVWLWAILIFVNVLVIGVFAFKLYRQYFTEEANFDQSTSEFELLAAVLIVISILSVVTILFLTSNLYTAFADDGIYLRFFPFQLKKIHYKKTDIAHWEVKKYSPLSEFGGWGLRISANGRGLAFNVMGNMGLRIKLKNGKERLIGTQDPEEVKDAMTKMMKN